MQENKIWHNFTRKIFKENTLCNFCSSENI